MLWWRRQTIIARSKARYLGSASPSKRSNSVIMNSISGEYNTLNAKSIDGYSVASGTAGHGSNAVSSPATMPLPMLPPLEVEELQDVMRLGGKSEEMISVLGENIVAMRDARTVGWISAS